MLFALLFACQKVDTDSGITADDTSDDTAGDGAFEYLEVDPPDTIEDGFVNAFLMEIGDEVVLFDSGFSSDGAKVLAALEARGLTAEDVDHLIVTHGHGDHVVALPVFSQARVYAMAVEEDLIAEESADGSTLTDPVADGEILEIGGAAIEVFSVPGHTAGSAVYLVGGALLMGDTAFAEDDGSIVGPPAVFSDDPEQNDASVRALGERLADRADDVDWLYFSHTGPLEGIGPLLAF